MQVLAIVKGQCFNASIVLTSSFLWTKHILVNLDISGSGRVSPRMMQDSCRLLFTTLQIRIAQMDNLCFKKNQIFGRRTATFHSRGTLSTRKSSMVTALGFI